MGLLDGLLGNALGSVLGGQQAGGGQGALINAVLGMLNNGSSAGGLQGMLSQLQQGGLGDQVASWVGTGQNLPVSAEQIMQALGGAGGGGGAGGLLSQLAQQTGMGQQDIAGHLSQMLPDVVNHLTPNGAVPQGGIPDALQALSGLLNR
ncbi:hypothetical protein IP84_06205 [beta proteobacterium AAP99]|nr:hypothetical protein IP84_06205 [beta proteobacterium AAP99]